MTLSSGGTFYTVRAGNARRAQPLTIEIESLGAKLFNHQCWFWGRDVWYPKGNVLIRIGFERFKVPEGRSGSNAYRFRVDEKRQVTLWGFGVYWENSDEGAIFILIGFNTPSACCGFIRYKTRQLLAFEFREQSF